MSNIGIIEGYFGDPWSMDARLEYPSLLSEMGYKFFIYAPKNDPHLRRLWDQQWPDDYINQLNNLVQSFHHHGIEFGIGFTPSGDASAVYQDASLLKRRLSEIVSSVPLDYFVLLFDDLVNNDKEKLAYYQIAITDIVLEQTSSVARHIICPSYYSFDPILEKVFGTRPENYWQEFAVNLDKSVDLFWTGEKVCSSGYSKEHLEKVTALLGRKPFLWDNYPVNDGKNMADYLYLEPFDQRGSELSELTSGHAINPMRQPRLNKIVLATLGFAYADKPLNMENEQYWRIAQKFLGKDAACALRQDWQLFAKTGLGAISSSQLENLKKKYCQIQSQGAVEILDYLNGKYVFDPACLT